MRATAKLVRPANLARAVENIDVARVFQEVADLLEIQGANPFRIRAYRNAARTVETLSTPVATLICRDKALEQLPGIGADLAGKIQQIVKTGKLGLLTQLTRRTPKTLVQLMHVPGLGPKRAGLLHKKLHVKTIADLEKALRAGKLRRVPGFKETLEARILKGIAERKAHEGRVGLAVADAYVPSLVAYLEKTPGITRLDVAGSYRRRQETVGDIDILVASSRGAAAGKRFVSYPDVQQVLAEGPTRCSIVLRSGLQVDLRVVPAASFGAALHYFTGSKPHNIAVRTFGVKHGLKISEYGVFRNRRRIAGREEAEVFASVGLPWIPPELRENRGELEAARAGTLPTLVHVDNLKGDVQMHTTYTDGHHDIAEMAHAAAELGYQYIAITDHTKSVRIAGGLDRRDFLRQFRDIDRVQKIIKHLTILKGAEVDILEDGDLDLDEETLKELDVVVVAVHSKLSMPQAAMTERILRALEHRRVQILGHPTGRLIGKREPSSLDMDAIVSAAVSQGVMLEINAQPDRLDLNDIYIRMAHEAGALLVINSDAHRTEELKCLRYGVDQARRGWCEPRHIANTRNLPDFMKLLRRA